MIQKRDIVVQWQLKSQEAAGSYYESYEFNFGNGDRSFDLEDEIWRASNTRLEHKLDGVIVMYVNKMMYYTRVLIKVLSWSLVS
jgi:hypothetical protein